MSVQAAMAEIEKDRDFYDESGGGVTFSGGEALSQPEFLYELLCGCSEAGIHTAVETCGHIPWSTFERVVPLVDLFLFDLKMMDPIIHEKFTGITNKRILTNLKRLSAISELIIRVPLIPGINDSPENIRSMGEFLGHLPGRHLIHLLPYHRLGAPKYERLNRPYPAEVIPPPAPERVERVRAELQGHGFEVVIGG
jgi:pyruvate formate lyase activating enzyme